MIMLLNHKTNLETSCFCISYYVNNKELYDLRHYFLNFLLLETEHILMDKKLFS